MAKGMLIEKKIIKKIRKKRDCESFPLYITIEYLLTYFQRSCYDTCVLNTTDLNHFTLQTNMLVRGEAATNWVSSSSCSVLISAMLVRVRLLAAYPV